MIRRFPKKDHCDLHSDMCMGRLCDEFHFGVALTAKSVINSVVANTKAG